MQQNQIAYHETMEVHEALNFKTVCALKSKLMQGIVFDKELKELMQADVEQSTKAIQELKALLSHAPTIH